MTQGSFKDRMAAVEEAISQLTNRIDMLEQAVANLAPASEIERLNLAFEMIEDRAPATEIERLNHAFELIAERAPGSEVERLDLAFKNIAERAPASETERLDYAIELIANFRASERVVEVPWVLGKYGGEKRVLEIGYAFAEEHYLASLLDLDIPFLVGLDAADSPRHESILPPHQVRADLLQGCFRDASFDLILCISTIEHIGRDNTIYGLDSGRDHPEPDHAAIRAMASWLALEGRLLLTVPFGRFEDHGWLINYDMEHLDSLIRASKLDVEEMTFFGWQPGGWNRVTPEHIATSGYRSMGAAHAAGVALVELRRGTM